MAKPEKRWQLLLVADDGRIVPFKRIKGIVITLAVLMVILGLVCAGLGWQLTVEKVQHGNTRDQLADANRQLDHYKDEVELITTELVLAQVRMEKAGLPVTRRHERIPQQASLKRAESEAAAVSGKTEGEATETGASKQETAEKPKGPEPSADMPEAAAGDADRSSDTEQASTQKPPAVVLGDLVVKHDRGKRVLSARFRVKNNDPRSGKVAGQCVVVLQKEGLEARSWLSMPKIALENGIPDGKSGRAFKISKFVDMEIMVPVEMDPSVFDVARVYVFEPSGAVIVHKDYPVVLPAPLSASVPKPKPAPSPSGATDAEPQPERPAVLLSDLKVTFDAATKVLLAQFKVSNNGSRSTPVSGRCVVVLKNGQDDPETWLAMPLVKLVDGKPQGTRGQAFRIARFRNMQIKTRGMNDPSVFKTAAVYVFDTSGAKLLEQSFPIDLPAPEPAPEPAPQAPPLAVPEPQATPAETPSAPAADQEPPAVEAPSAAPDQPQAEPTPEAGAETTAPPVPTPAPAPSDDPSLTEGVEPKAQEDSRSRF